jgi:hypothetical protein
MAERTAFDVSIRQLATQRFPLIDALLTLIVYVAQFASFIMIFSLEKMNRKHFGR